jgi:hypothetical protein
LRAATIGQFLVASRALFGSRSGYEILVKRHRDIGGTACAEMRMQPILPLLAATAGFSRGENVILLSPSAALCQMSIPDYQSLMLPVLVACSKRIWPVVDELANQLGLSPEERTELLPSGQQTVFSNRVHWAKAYLSKAQLVEITRRGYFRITPRGQTVLESSPQKIDNKFLTQFEEFRQFRERSTVTALMVWSWLMALCPHPAGEHGRVGPTIESRLDVRDVFELMPLGD